MLVVYTPDGVGASDRLEFTLTDGVHTHSGALDFTVTARHREGPRMTVNRGLQLAAGEQTQIHEHKPYMDCVILYFSSISLASSIYSSVLQ
jgi:hypothetical protein